MYEGWNFGDHPGTKLQPVGSKRCCNPNEKMKWKRIFQTSGSQSKTASLTPPRITDRYHNPPKWIGTRDLGSGSKTVPFIYRVISPKKINDYGGKKWVLSCEEGKKWVLSCEVNEDKDVAFRRWSGSILEMWVAAKETEKSNSFCSKCLFRMDVDMGGFWGVWTPQHFRWGVSDPVMEGLKTPHHLAYVGGSGILLASFVTFEPNL